MKVVLQRVSKARVHIEGQTAGAINKGALVFLGVGKDDSSQDADYLIQKLVNLRMFEDEGGKMNLSVLQAGGEFLVVSQFTLYGDCDKGRRPSFDAAADPQKAEQLYNYFVETLQKQNVKVETGRFRAMMDVELVNDGPVTFVLESKR